MGRLIDADVLKDIVKKWLPKDPCGHEELEYPYGEDICVSTLMTIEEQPTIEVIPKADYEKRLNADLKAILVKLQLEIEECVDGAEGSPQFEQGVTIAREQVVKMIQQQINELEGEHDPTPQI